MYFSFPFLRELLEFMFFLFITHYCFTQGLDRPQPPFSSVCVYIYIKCSFFFPLLCFFYPVCYTMLQAPCSYPNISYSFTLKDNSICHFIPIIIFLLWWQLRHLIKENLNVLILKNPSKFTHSDSSVYNCQDMEAT